MTTLFNEKVIEAIQASLESKHGKVYSRKDIKIIMKEIFNTILLEVLKGNTVTIREFGRFYSKVQSGVTPVAGKYTSLTLKFSAANSLRKILNPLKKGSRNE